MTLRTFVRRSRIEAPVDDLLRWHARTGALERLAPPWRRVELLDPGRGIEPGSRVELRARVGPLWRSWVARHGELEGASGFRDEQVEGPFARWEHEHRFEPDGPRASWLEDRILWELPGEPLSGPVAAGYVERSLERMFAYRHRVTATDLRRHVRAALDTGTGPLRVLVTGATGLVGSALASFLSAGGHEVRRMVRREPRRSDEIEWSSRPFRVRPEDLEGADAVVHLAGESIAAHRWSDGEKERIRRSRVDVTAELCRALAQLERPPAVLVCASATGFYGDRGTEELDETSAPGQGFLAETCRASEAAAEPLTGAGARVVHARFGVVLSPAGGALRRMLTPFALGLGGTLGGGDQVLGWIALDDAVAALHHALLEERVAGPMNVVAPEPVANRELARTLGRVLSRPAVLPAPGIALRLALGEMADALLLASARVRPAVLERTGFVHDYPRLEGALRHVLGRA